MYIKRLKDLREDNDLTQKEIANSINVKQQSYSYYETGERNIPIEKIIDLAYYYNTSIDYILGITDEKKPYKRNGPIDWKKTMNLKK